MKRRPGEDDEDYGTADGGKRATHGAAHGEAAVVAGTTPLWTSISTHCSGAGLADMPVGEEVKAWRSTLAGEQGGGEAGASGGSGSSGGGMP